MKKTSLYEEHTKLSGKIVDFAGWALPVQYSSILNEHLHTREKAGIFDIGHMGEFIIEGENAGEILNTLISSNISSLKEKKCRYGLLTNEEGGVIDDMITYRLEENKYMVVCNASRQEADFNWFKNHLPPEISLKDISEETSKIDLQGPLSFDVLLETLSIDATHLKYFQIDYFNFNNREITVSRTGYTGELGVEIYCPNEVAVEIWQKLISHENVKAIGLGARDTLRLEVGLALYGHELNEEVLPNEANLMRFVSLDSDFTGKEKIVQSIENPTKALVGLALTSKRAARDGMLILDENDIEVGAVTSGSVAPSLGIAIALGYVTPNCQKIGTKLNIDNGRTKLEATVVELPFFKDGTARRKLQL
ncbi:MAG: glycine cleavage system protein T [Planctomycetota bacterium]|nr:MAG: glycine cleavage system protein T [Planctomycetota bacterium]